MRAFIIFLKEHRNPFRILKWKSKLRSYIAISLSLAVLNLTIGCSYYNTKPVTTTPETLGKHIEDFNEAGKYATVHSGDTMFHLDNIVIDADNQTVSGIARVLNSKHNYSKILKERGNRYKHSQQDPMNEIHLYLDIPLSHTVDETVTIPLVNISSLSINKPNTGRSVVNVIMGTVGILAGLTILAVALKSSCPFVYIKDGNSYTFMGDLYPGVISPNLQHNDYLPLPNFKAEHSEYTLMITNELKEVHHTDLAELIVIEHEKDTQVLLDRKGDVQTFFNPALPTSVYMDDVIPNLQPALESDNNVYRFDSEIESAESTRNLIFTFDQPENVKKGKLLLTVKNSLWLDYVYGKFNEQFGVYFNTYQESYQNDPVEKSRAWASAQHLPLSIYIEKENGWELQEEINAVGPLAQRNLVIPLDLSGINSKTVKLKLETGFMFWEVDQLGMDYSENRPVTVSHLKPSKAIDETGKDVAHLLREADQNYFTQSKNGSKVVVTFASGAENPDKKRSVFIKNKGYYNYIRNYKGVPDIDYLKSFEHDGAFTQFAIERFQEMVNSEQELLACGIE